MQTPLRCFAIEWRIREYLVDEKLFLDIIDARNKTTHVYAEDEAQKIYEFIRGKASQAFIGAAEKLESDLKSEIYR